MLIETKYQVVINQRFKKDMIFTLLPLDVNTVFDQRDKEKGVKQFKL